MSETLYKVLGPNLMPFHGGDGQWPYRKWTPNIQPIPCEQGYHVCRLDQMLSWLGPEIWVVEVRGEVVDHGDKLVAESARLVRRTPWNSRSARLFAADCAERVLPIFERSYPNDSRPRNAIEVARLFAIGQATAAAGDAAGAAAGDAAWDAAWDAARAAAWDALEPTRVSLQASALELLDRMIEVGR